MRASFVGATLLPALVFFASTPLRAQAPDQGLLRWAVSVADAEPLVPTPRSYRLFESKSDVTLIFTFSNDSESPVGINSDPFKMGVEVSVAVGQSPLSTLLEWETAIRRPGDSVTQISPGEQFRVGPREGFEWRATVRRADGAAFEPAAYEVDVDLTSSLRAVQNLDTGVDGIRGLSTTRLAFVIESTTTATTRAAMHRVRAQAALREGRPADAIAAFVQALEAAPTDVNSLAGLGNAYMALNRYREAIVVYERALPAVLGVRGPVPLLLAQAYVALNDDSNAARVLRLSGKRETEIADEIRQLRDLARRRGNAR